MADEFRPSITASRSRFIPLCTSQRPVLSRYPDRALPSEYEMQPKIQYLPDFNVLAMAKLQRSRIPFNLDSFSKLNGPLLLLGAVLTLIALQLFRTWWRLRYIPGPFIASFTNFQRVWWVKTKRAHLIHQQMHEKYGAVVRIGPNMVSISNPEAIPTVYPMRPGFIKVRILGLTHHIAEYRR